MISKIRAISAAIYILILVPFGTVLMYLLPHIQRNVRQWIARNFLLLFGVKAYTKGEMDTSAQVLIMNHQSFLDVIYFEAMHPNNLCWIAKKELGDLFLYGHALKASKMILINRENKKELVHLLKEAKNRLDNGRTLCIFPEGTRSLGGAKFLPFKSGAKILVEHFGLKVQPIVFCQTRKCFDIGGIAFTNTPIQVQYLPAFTPNGAEWFESLKEQMQEAYTEMYQKVESDLCMVK